MKNKETLLWVLTILNTVLMVIIFITFFIAMAQPDDNDAYYDSLEKYVEDNNKEMVDYTNESVKDLKDYVDTSIQDLYKNPPSN